MQKRQKQNNSSGIKWPTEVDMLLNKTQTQTQSLIQSFICWIILEMFQGRELSDFSKRRFRISMLLTDIGR